MAKQTCWTVLNLKCWVQKVRAERAKQPSTSCGMSAPTALAWLRRSSLVKRILSISSCKCWTCSIGATTARHSKASVSICFLYICIICKNATLDITSLNLSSRMELGSRVLSSTLSTLPAATLYSAFSKQMPFSKSRGNMHLYIYIFIYISMIMQYTCPSLPFLTIS